MRGFLRNYLRFLALWAFFLATFFLAFFLAAIVGTSSRNCFLKWNSKDEIFSYLSNARKNFEKFLHDKHVCKKFFSTY